MSLTQLFYRKLKLQMKLLHIVDKKPKHIIKLDPIDNQDFIISLQSVAQWSQDNHQLYELILASGMAEFICNREYLFEFYRHLDFSNQNVIAIDQDSLHFKHLKVLNLTGCNIKVVQNIPHNCKQLYLDFNLIEDINNRQPNTLELLSLSHNAVDDSILAKIVNSCKELRCLNVSWNRIENIREFVQMLSTLEKLKILVGFGNPVSMLAIYYSYITERLKLGYFDGSKYVKVEEVKKQEPKVQEKKEVVKEQKKDAKKDNKKGAKVQEKPAQEPPKVQQKVQVKRQLTNEDFQKVKLTLEIGNIQQFTGNIFDPSLFPADIDIKKTQTNYWFKCQLFGTSFEQKDKIIAFDNATLQNQQTRLNLAIKINKEISVNFDTFQSFNDGIKVQVHQVEPKMVKDAQTLQLKPEIVNGEVTMTSSIVGAAFIDLRTLHIAQKKQLKYKYRLFSSNAVSNALFLNPYEDQVERIKSKKQKFQSQLKMKEEERIKKLEQQQLLKQQKKGGAKDQKKGADKKASKKEGKDAVVAQKRKSQKCDFPIHEREYCILEDNKMFKGKQLLCVRVLIQ